MGEANRQLTPREESAIAYIPLPRYAQRISLRTFLLAVAAASGAFLLWGWIDPTMRESAMRLSLIVWLAVPVGLAAMTLPPSDRASHIPVSFTNSLTECIVPLDAGLTTVYVHRKWWTWSEFLQKCREAAVDPPRTIVDERLRSRLNAIELPSEMLEPEPILQSGPTGRLAAKFALGFYFVFTMLQIAVGHYVFAAYFAAFAILVGISYPPVRDLFRNARWDDGNVVSGVGWLSHKGRRRWTADDSVMLVQTTGGKPPFFTSFVGEAGFLRLTFTDEEDPDFVKLWQRWNHPKPRPELVVD